MVLLVVHVGGFHYTCYIMDLQTWICGPTGGPCWQVLLYMLYKRHAVLLVVHVGRLYYTCCIKDMRSYWWSMLAGFTIHAI